MSGREGCVAIHERSGRHHQAASAAAVVPGTGPAAGLAAFAQPLLDGTDGSREQVDSAMQIAALFRNLALIPDEEMREQELGEMLDGTEQSAVSLVFIDDEAMA